MSVSPPHSEYALTHPSPGVPAVAPTRLRVARETIAELDWRYYVRAVSRRKRLVTVMVLLGLAAGIAVSRLLKPTYAARAHLWIDVAKDGGGNPGPTWSNQIMGSTAWIDLLRSDLMVVEAVRNQRLYLSPRRAQDATRLTGFAVKQDFQAGIYRLTVDETGSSFTLESKDEAVSLTGAVGDPIGSELGFSWQPTSAELPPNTTVDFEVVSLYQATSRLLEFLDVRPGRERNFLRVELRGADPVQIAATVNSMSEHLVRLAGDLKRQKLTELTAILGDQLEQAKVDLRTAEDSLKAFRLRTATALVADQAALPTGALATRVEEEQLRTDRHAIARVLQSADSGGSIHALERIGAVQRTPDLTRALADLTEKEAELRVLRRRYTDEHPGIAQLAADVDRMRSGTVRLLAEELMGELASAQQRLTQRVEAASADLRELSPLPVEEARLSRNVRVGEELFVSLRRRYEEARLAEVSVTPDVRLLDVAKVPEKPLFNRTPLVVAFALMGSLIASICLAVLLEIFDPKVRYASQIARDLGVPVLGMVPHVPPQKNSGVKDVAPVIEALRGVRFNVLHAQGASAPLHLTVTSPGPGDGKSFISSNLALAFADSRYRTLLIDGDIRRGSLHRVVSALRKPGLTDYLAGEATRETITQQTKYAGLSFIGSGTRRRGGPELLSSVLMTRLFADLRPHYDVIIVDSSPLAAGIDPYALGTLTGNLLLVLRTGVTNRQLAEAKLDLVARLPIRVIGSVINDVRPNGESEYYSYYLAGYELDEEVTTHGVGTRILPRAEVGVGGG